MLKFDSGFLPRANEAGITVLSWNIGFHNGSKPAAQTYEFATHGQLAITRRADGVTPLLLRHCLNGREVPRATLAVAGEDGNPALRLTLEGVIIASYDVAGDGAGMPLETIGLAYRKITVAAPGPRETSVPDVFHDLVRQEVG
ncbi:type VI secretion system tube protein Hcp [Sphingomonas canadensis]|uniref:type VI secretion system tube protein Hcp n=1 Tax=Sphingomonas canadensis TaxID=1219257 RepID=UPI002231C434|nr:type VI secretion system tube protein Hcp [Sphingomonas canadensis]